MIRYYPFLKQPSRRLRCGMTDAEQRPWHHLRRKQVSGVQCYRQKPLGRYIVDFYLPAARLVIEIDGSQHASREGVERDATRTAYLESAGLRVLRFDNRQVLTELAAVLEVIWQEVQRIG